MGTFPEHSSATALIGAVLAEQHEEWVKQRRYMGQELLFRVAPAKAGQDENEGVMAPMAAVAQDSAAILRWRCIHHFAGRDPEKWFDHHYRQPTNGGTPLLAGG